MSQVFNSIDLRRKIFNFKSASLKQEAKKNFDNVLLELNTHLFLLWDERDGLDLADNTNIEHFTGEEIGEEYINNLTQNEFHTFMIREKHIQQDIYFPTWTGIILSQIIEHNIWGWGHLINYPNNSNITFMEYIGIRRYRCIMGE